MQEASKAIANTAPEVMQGSIAKVSGFPANGAAPRLQGAAPLAGEATMKATIKEHPGH